MEGLLLFGGSGYIGSNLAIGLKNDYNIIIIDKVPQPEWFDGEYFQQDLTVPHLTIQPKQKAKFAIILAALKDVVEGEEQPYDYCRDNINIAINSIELCESLGIKNILFVSSCAVYHTPSSCANPPLSFKETDTQTGELPLGIYGFTKKATEDVVTALANSKKDVRVALLRYANLMGSVSSHRLFPKAGVVAVLAKRPKEFYQRGDGLRDYIDVKDLVEMHRLLLKRWDETFIVASLHIGIKNPLVFNFGTGVITATSDIVNMFREVSEEE